MNPSSEASREVRRVRVSEKNQLRTLWPVVAATEKRKLMLYSYLNVSMVLTKKKQKKNNFKSRSGTVAVTGMYGTVLDYLKVEGNA